VIEKKEMGAPPKTAAALLPGSAQGLVTACHEGPAGRGQAVMRSSAPSSPAWRAAEEIYSVNRYISRQSGFPLHAPSSRFFLGTVSCDCLPWGRRHTIRCPRVRQD